MSDWIGGAISGGLGLLGNIIDIPFKVKSNQIANRQNDINERTLNWNIENATNVLNWNKEQYYNTMEYNKWLNQTQMEREDNAIQRRMADLKAAGLSPLLAAGDAASSSAGSGLTTPELQSAEMNGVNFQGHQPLQIGLQDAWNKGLQNMYEFSQLSKSDAEKSLISSQAQGQNLENQRTVDTMIYESNKRIQELSKGSNEITLQLAQIDEMQRKARADNDKHTLDQLDITKKEFENQAAQINNQILEETKRQEELKTKVSEHDTNVYMASPFTSTIVDQGMKTTAGQIAQDASLGVATARSNERNNNLYDNYVGNQNSTQNQEIESVPNIGEIERGPNYQDDGVFYATKKKTFYKAGYGVAYGKDGSIYYGGKKLKPSEDYPFEYILNQIENTGMVPVDCIYSD